MDLVIQTGACQKIGAALLDIIFQLCSDGPLISWTSRKQQTVAFSTCAAEKFYSEVQFVPGVEIISPFVSNHYENPLTMASSQRRDISYSELMFCKVPGCRYNFRNVKDIDALTRQMETIRYASYTLAWIGCVLYMLSLSTHT